MLNKILVSIFLIFLLSNQGFCQESFTVKLTLEKGGYPYALSHWIEGERNFDKSFFKGIPDSIKALRIVDFDFNRLQGVYESYCQNKMKKSDSIFLEQMDTTEFSRVPIRHRVFFISGFYKGNKIIIPDLNGNNDFSDEKALLFSPLAYRTKENYSFNDTDNILTFSYEYFEKTSQKVVSKFLRLEVLPNNPSVYAGKNQKDIEFDFFIRVAEHRKGAFQMGQKCFDLVVSPAPGSFDDYEYDFRLYFDTCQYNFDRTYESEEVVHKYKRIKIGDYYYQIKLNRFGDSAFFTCYGQNKYREINRQRIHDGVSSKVDLSAYKGKYLILDFWGLWCHPCIKAMPNLKKMNDLLDKSKVEIIGIAYDTNKKKIQNFLTEKGYNWVNLFEDMNPNNAPISFVKELKISAFPTMLLVDPEGRIVEENLPIDNLFKFREILSTYIK